MGNPISTLSDPQPLQAEHRRALSAAVVPCAACAGCGRFDEVNRPASTGYTACPSCGGSGLAYDKAKLRAVALELEAADPAAIPCPNGCGALNWDAVAARAHARHCERPARCHVHRNTPFEHWRGAFPSSCNGCRS